MFLVCKEPVTVAPMTGPQCLRNGCTTEAFVRVAGLPGWAVAASSYPPSQEGHVASKIRDPSSVVFSRSPPWSLAPSFSAHVGPPHRIFISAVLEYRRG